MDPADSLDCVALQIPRSLHVARLNLFLITVTLLIKAINNAPRLFVKTAISLVVVYLSIRRPPSNIKTLEHEISPAESGEIHYSLTRPIN
jgi:hypothetical protein